MSGAVARRLDHAGGFGVLRIKLGYLDLFGEAKLREKPDAVVVNIELIPLEAMARADWMGVVVVVPAFAAGKQRDPPVVAGVVFCFEAALAPEVRGRVNEPCSVEADGNAKEGSPENHTECADDVVAGWCKGCANGDLDEAAND